MAEPIEALKWVVDIDGKRAIKTVSTLDRAMHRAMKSMAKSTNTADKGLNSILKHTKKFGSELPKKLKLTDDQLNLVNSKIKATPKLLENSGRVLDRLTKRAEGYEAAMKGASEASVAGLAKEAAEVQKLIRKEEQRIEGLKEQRDLLEDIEKMQGSANLGRVFSEATDDMASNTRREMEASFKDFVMFDGKATRREMADAFGDAMGSISSRDMGGFAKSLANFMGKGLKGAGAGMTRVGMGAASDPNAGKTAKLLGGMTAKMGPLVEGLSKMGPILGVAAGAMMAVVKLFLDADAAAKEFNKELLSTASTGELLTSNLGNVEAAAEDLKDTMKSLRDAANDFSKNNEWGISKADHTAVMSSLTAEGVSIKRIKDEAKAAGKELSVFSGDLVHVAVAYSRNFGVSLNDITSLQTEMMNDLGMSFSTVEKQFAKMAAGAAESGMASNKFFNIIKNVSSDLALYNMRMEDAVHMLTLLGKVMSPRNAAKFMQQTMQGFKNMGRSEKLRMTLLTGEKETKALVDRDLKRKTKDTAESIAGGVKGTNADDIAEMIKKGDPKLRQIVKQLPEAQQGAINESISQIRTDTKRSKRGLFGLSTATGNLGAAGVFEMFKKSIGRFGGKNLEESAGSIGGEMMAEQLGVSQEQLDQAIKFEQAIGDQKDTLKEAVDHSTKSAEEKAKEKAKIDAMDTDQVLDTMSKEDKAVLQDAGKQIDQAKRQSELTQSISEKLSNMMDWFMNQFYNIMIDIWDAITSIPGVGMSGNEKSLRKTVLASKDKGLMDVLSESKGDETRFQQLSAKRITDSIEDAFKRLSEAKTEEEKRVAGDQIQAFSQFAGAKDAGVKGVGSASAAMRDVGMDQGKAADITNLMQKEGATFEQAMSKFNVDADTRAKLLESMFTSMSAQDLAARSPYLSLKGAAPTAKGSPAASDQPVGAKTTADTAAISSSIAVSNSPASEIAKQAEVTSDGIDQMNATLGQKGIKIDKPFMKNEFQKRMEEAVLDGMRAAMFEYYLYSGLDRNQVLSSGITGSSVKDLASTIASTGTAEGGLATIQAAHANAAGGVVMKPAAGEYMASVAPGETIVPKGGTGGGKYTVENNFQTGVDPAFVNIIKQKVQEGIVEHERRKKYQ